MRESIPLGLTFDDLLLLPDYSEILPRDAELHTRLTPSITLNIPLLSAAMDTVTESALAIALAQLGGLGLIHKNMPVPTQAAQVRQVKKYESGVVSDPITIDADASLRDLLELKKKHNNISGVPVLRGGQLQGIVSNRDIRYETSLDTPVSALMTPKEKLVTIPESAEINVTEVRKLLHKHRIEKVLVVDDAFHLRGMVTSLDLDRETVFPDACKDQAGRLRVGAAVGVGADSEERAAALVEAGADVLGLDTAHGHSKNVLERLRWMRRSFPDISLIAGNIATADAARALADAGADAVKIGIGPGSICTTRVVTGVGAPQVSAVFEVAEALRGREVFLIADGGVRYSGDLAKALAAGSDAVMLGGMFAGTEEAPGEIELYEGRTYKSYRGMGSIGAMGGEQGSGDRYAQEGSPREKLVPEGIEGRVPYRGPLANVVWQLMGGLRSSMGYTGCRTIPELQERARFIRISPAGFREGHVHDVSITREAPNYPRN